MEIDQINSNETNSFRAGLNFMSDFFGYELDSLSDLKRRPRPPAVKDSKKQLKEISRPDYVDWRLNKAFTGIRDQTWPNKCGGDCANSATGAIEGDYAKKTGILLPLSAQQLIDCNYKNGVCEGGDFVEAFDYD